MEEYLIDLNGTQAAIRAGYSKKTAGVIASQARAGGQESEPLMPPVDTMSDEELKAMLLEAASKL